MQGDTDHANTNTARIAVFDFDGTVLKGKSPVILIRTLLKRHQVAIGNTFAITMWGLAYKMHVPVSEEWVRGRVFRAFAGMPQQTVDTYLKRFFDEKLGPRLRDSMLEEIELRRLEGCVLVTVSATFQPIVDRMVELGILDHAIATRMVVDEAGNYTSHCDGDPVEGPRKVEELERWADATYGRNAWRLEWAYSDHYSDKPLLERALNAVAVDPDKTLGRAARKRGWRIISE